jgi:eukaryotic-like serine/threonine-protein kinase
VNDLCPTDETFARFAARELPTSEHATVLIHIETCDRCRRVAAMLISSSVSKSLSDTEPGALLPGVLGPGIVLGPYHLIRLLGEGATATVFAAWDPRLERQVAVKVLHRDSALLQDEARLMARLSHPNIVAVYEVAEWQGRLVLVMELVPGGTLREWLRGQPPLREVLRVFEALAFALTAAHAAGVMHRDFKPDNVLLDAQGMPRLSDFGLSRLATTLSERAVIVGTPAYLAPAQLDGKPGDEAADQFAFCVSLWEAVTKERPFRGSTLQQLRKAHLSPPLKSRGARMPRWLEAVLRKGMSADPAQRFPSMRALALALRRGPATTRRAAIAVGALVVLASVAWQLSRGDPCEGVGTEFAAAVNPARLLAIDRQFAGSGVSYSSISSAEVGRVLQDAATRLSAESRALCEDSARKGASGLSAGVVQSRCLTRRGRDLEALVEAFERADRVTVERSVAATLNLVPAETCRDVHESAVTEEETRKRLEIAALRPLIWTGQWAELTKRLNQLRPQLTAFDGGIVATEWRWLEAYEAVSLERSEGLERSRACVGAALASRSDAIAAECLLYLAMLEAGIRRQPETGRASLEVAKALLGRTPHTPREEMALAMTEIMILRAEGRHDVALEAARQRATTFSRTYGDQHYNTLTMLGLEAYELASIERYAEARDLYQRVFDVFRRTLGEHQPKSLLVLEAMGFLDLRLERLDLALVELTEVLEAHTASLGPDSYLAAHARVNRGAVLARLGRLDEAQSELERAMAVYVRDRGPKHLIVAEPTEELARVAMSRGLPSVAVSYLEKAVAIRVDEHDRPVRVARSRLALAKALVALAGDRAPPARVRVLATEAEVTFHAAGPAFEADLQAARAVLARLR